MYEAWNLLPEGVLPVPEVGRLVPSFSWILTVFESPVVICADLTSPALIAATTCPVSAVL